MIIYNIIDSNNLKTIPDFTGLMNEENYVNIGDFDGWIIGDDPCTEKVIQHGIKGNLKALVKWGVGVDNVDFDALKNMTYQFQIHLLCLVKFLIYD